jgi:NADH-quinone oxidoreductase subunit E
MSNLLSIVPTKEIDEVISLNKGKSGEVLGILEEIQEKNRFKFLPEETLSYISAQMNIPLSQIYSVVTFYSFFNLKPQGKNVIIVCRGTACHTKGSKELLNDAASIIGIHGGLPEGESSYTTPDNMYTIKTVACFGQCALSPVISINNTIYSSMNVNKLRSILTKLQKKGGNK